MGWDVCVVCCKYTIGQLASQCCQLWENHLLQHIFWDCLFTTLSPSLAELGIHKICLAFEALGCDKSNVVVSWETFKTVVWDTKIVGKAPYTFVSNSPVFAAFSNASIGSTIPVSLPSRCNVIPEGISPSPSWDIVFYCISCCCVGICSYKLKSKEHCQ